MIVVKDSEKQIHVLSETASVQEYNTTDPALGGAVASVEGRYPKKGFVVNLEVKQLAYVISGMGKIVTPEGVHELAAGDMVFVAANEKYAWEGNLELFIANAPRFDSKQYREVE
ncbi:MAG: hypothetical protein WC464_03610 [Bdellovibrionales bacterium]